MAVDRRSPSRWKQLRYRLEAVGLRAAAWGVQRLSRPAMLRLARALGWLAYLLSPGARRIARANLDLAFGDSRTPREKARIARQSIQNFAATMLGLLWAPRLTPQLLDEILEVDWDYLRRLRGRGRGVIFVTPHYGDWEMLGIMMGFKGFPPTIVVEQMRNPAVERILAGHRAISGNRIISQGSAVLKLFRSLRRGGWTAALIDLNATRSGGGVWVDFFGLPVFNNSSIAWLALKTGAAVVGAVGYPQPDGRLRVVWGPEIDCTPTGDFEADVAALSGKCLAFCEQVIREHPEHWLWTYKRWKRRPYPEQGRYPDYSKYAPISLEPSAAQAM